MFYLPQLLRNAARLCATITLVLVSACAAAPTQEISDARRAWQATQSVGAEHLVAEQLVTRAKARIDLAEQAINTGAYDHARQEALAAKRELLAVHDLVIALRQAARLAERLPADSARTADVMSMLRAAQSAALNGDTDTAMQLAQRILKIQP
ncbi:MAG: hypothetical protein HOI95_27980 [Chromatiales bacterium]|jgi:hypothetical protein|nr:hypothetical protein [Chromatiales bacterium]